MKIDDKQRKNSFLNQLKHLLRKYDAQIDMSGKSCDCLIFYSYTQDFDATFKTWPVDFDVIERRLKEGE